MPERMSGGEQVNAKKPFSMMGSKTTEKPETELSKHLHFQVFPDATSKQLNSSPHTTICSRVFNFNEL